MIDELRSVSVVIPTHGGLERLPRLLESLDRQTLDRDCWEVVFVCNGVDDGSARLLLQWGDQSDIESRVLVTPEAGAGLARNLGIANARADVITFVDDDDWIEPRFVEVGLLNTTESCIALLPIKDETVSGVSDENSLNARRAMLAGSTVPVREAVWTLGFNASKFVPAKVLKQWRYSENLASGEDVAFFANLLRVPNLHLVIPQDADDAAYVRVVRDNSVSRRAQSFDFNVAQRLDVIAQLRKIPVALEAEKALESLVSSQFNFVSKWLGSRPEDLKKAANYSIAVGAYGLDWKHIPRRPTRRLVFSYCFPPFADPAANVAAKRIAERQEDVDVVSADMSPVRELDHSTQLLVDPWVHRHVTVKGYPSFSSWPAIASFGRKAVRSASGTYDTVYSRALWSGSHVAGALYKIKHPTVKWEAEFSDPMRWDAKGNPRPGGPASGRVARRLQRGIESAGGQGELHTCRDSHFALTELATLCLADQLVFTNQNQLNQILSSYSEAFAETVFAKSSVQPQPVPPEEAYQSATVDLRLDRSKLNLAYFGNFYANRGLGDFADALDCLTPEQAEQVVLHVFSVGANGPVIRELIRSGHIVHHEPLNYLEFLSACKQFDALLVVDTATSGTTYGQNPFLPSKLSDYMGSGTPVWAMIEPGSPLSGASPQFVSELGCPEQAARELIQIAALRE